MYIPEIDDYLKILTDEEVMDFVAINFSEYFKSKGEKQNLRTLAKSYLHLHLLIFLKTLDKVEKYMQ